MVIASQILHRFVLTWALRRLPLVAGVALATLAGSVGAQEAQRGAVEHFLGTLVRQTASACPLASPADQAALDHCRSVLYGDSAFRRGLAPVVLWGRPSPEGKRLRDTNATQFSPDVLSGLLLQTPVHAAGEIKRVMQAVRDDKMPLDDTGIYKELDPAVRAALLKYGAAFKSVIDAARDWEAKNP